MTAAIEFAPEIVAQVWDEVQALPASQFRRDELATFATDQTLSDLHGSLLRVALRGGDEAEGNSCSGGFLLTHRILRTIVDPLPVRSPLVVAGYRRLLLSNNNRLETDFRRDYQAHPAILELVDGRMRIEVSRHSAKLLFNLYGSLANPDRPPVLIPTVQETTMRPNRHAKQIGSQRRSSRGSR